MKFPKVNPYLALAIGVFSISTSAIFVKLSSANAGIIAFYRLFFTILFMLPFIVFKYRKDFLTIKCKDWLFSIIVGIFLAFHFILWFESLNYTSVASSTVLVTLQPLFAFIGTFLFFHEKLSLRAISCAIVAIIGSFIISWGDLQISGSALYGDILALAACALITAYLLFGQTVRKRVSLMTYTFIVYCVSMLVLFMYVLFINKPFFPYAKIEWVYFLALALIATLLGHSLLNWAVKWVSTSTISMAILFEPIGASILAVLILNETMIWTQIVGGIIILISVAMFLFYETKHNHLDGEIAKEKPLNKQIS